MARACLGGITLHYRRWGSDGPEVVLVHGLATDMRFWQPKIAPRLASDFLLTAFDLRGHGQSDMPASGYTTADMADDLDGLLDHLGIRRAHLVGHSYGGALILHYAVVRPERVTSLTVADARIRALEPPRNGNADDPWAWMHQLTNVGVPRPAPGIPGSQLLEALAETRLRDGEGLPKLLGFGVSARSSQAAERWLQLLQTTTARRDVESTAGLTLRRIRQIRVPVLTLYGERSNCLASCRGLRRNLPQCRAVVVPGLGHFHPRRRPEFFLREVREFLGGLERRDAGHEPRDWSQPDATR